MRYAYDFVLLDSGRQFKTDGKRDEDYFGWAKPVFAVGAGKVIAAVGSYKDDHQFHIPSLANDPMALYGNYVAIRHADSSVSVYAHLKQNSLKVQKGATISAGQEIGAIGASGSSFFPHLHFEIRTDLTHTAEGLPSYFSNVQLVEGTKKIYLRSGLVETGNIIEAR
jgi:murein DD-endopeptidase MepM/ murein hydrolase activator NlpD